MLDDIVSFFDPNIKAAFQWWLLSIEPLFWQISFQESWILLWFIQQASGKLSGYIYFLFLKREVRVAPLLPLERTVVPNWVKLSSASRKDPTPVASKGKTSEWSHGHWRGFGLTGCGRVRKPRSESVWIIQKNPPKKRGLRVHKEHTMQAEKWDDAAADLHFSRAECSIRWK